MLPISNAVARKCAVLTKFLQWQSILSCLPKNKTGWVPARITAPAANSEEAAVAPGAVTKRSRSVLARFCKLVLLLFAGLTFSCSPVFLQPISGLVASTSRWTNFFFFSYVTCFPKPDNSWKRNIRLVACVADCHSFLQTCWSRWLSDLCSVHVAIPAWP